MNYSAADNVDPSSGPTQEPSRARLHTSLAVHGRLFQTDEPLPCATDPDAFFNSRTQRRAVTQCSACSFRGRCGYNAITSGATHGIWGGVIFPGNYPAKLSSIYNRLSEQFDQRSQAELGYHRPIPQPDADTSRSRAA
jgi:WhiB family transcriptional regulator, redox-sensing transcriptional regulator